MSLMIPLREALDAVPELVEIGRYATVPAKRVGYSLIFLGLERTNNRNWDMVRVELKIRPMFRPQHEQAMAEICRAVYAAIEAIDATISDFEREDFLPDAGGEQQLDETSSGDIVGVISFVVRGRRRG